MKVTFIAPFHVNIWEALWAGYLISYWHRNYKKQDLQFDFLHGNFDPIFLSDVYIKKAAESDIVGISCTPAYAQYPSSCREASCLLDKYEQRKEGRGLRLG